MIGVRHLDNSIRVDLIAKRVLLLLLLEERLLVECAVVRGHVLLTIAEFAACEATSQNLIRRFDALSAVCLVNFVIGPSFYVPVEISVH